MDDTSTSSAGNVPVQEQSEVRNPGLVRRLWIRSKASMLVIATILGLPLITPLVGITLSQIPGVQRHVRVEYPPQLSQQAATIKQVMHRSPQRWLSDKYALLTSKGRSTELCICAATVVAFIYLLSFHFAPILIVCLRHRAGFLAAIFMLIGATLWMRLAALVGTGVLGGDAEAAGCIWPSFASWEKGLSWIGELTTNWTSIETRYFGWDLGFPDMFWQLEWMLLLFGLHIALFFAGFSALNVFQYNWRNAWKTKNTPVLES